MRSIAKLKLHKRDSQDNTYRIEEIDYGKFHNHYVAWFIVFAGSLAFVSLPVILTDNALGPKWEWLQVWFIFHGVFAILGFECIYSGTKMDTPLKRYFYLTSYAAIIGIVIACILGVNKTVSLLWYIYPLVPEAGIH